MIRRTNDRPHEQHPDWGRYLAGDTETHRAGVTLFSPGDQAHDLLILLAGKVGLFLRSDEGRSVTIKMVEPGQLFGHVALIDETYDVFAETLSDVHVQRVGRSMAERAIAAEPAFGLVLVEELGRYRKIVGERLDEVAFKSVPARLASVLLDLAHRHGGRVPRVSHRQLAEMVNAYRETVTKVINQFRTAQLLEIDTSSITLLNLRRLEELARS